MVRKHKRLSRHRSKVKRAMPESCGMEREDTGFTCKQCGASWIDRNETAKPNCLYGLKT